MSPSIRPCWAVVAVAFGLTGCAAVGPDFQAPAPLAATAYLPPGEPAARGVVLGAPAAANAPWWTALGSPALDRLIRQALADSPTVAEADAVLQRAQAQEAVETGARLPQVDANAGLQRERINIQSFGFGAFPNSTINLYSVGGAVSYDLDLFGGQRRAVEAAGADTGAQAQRAQAARLTLSGDIALQAAKVAALRAQLAAQEAMVADDHRLIDMVRQAEKAGGASRSAIPGGLSQLAEDEAMLPPLRRDIAAARRQLALLAGKSPDWPAPDFTLEDFAAPAAVPVAMPSALAHGRPDILAAEAELHAATARVGVATAAQYPDIRLTAGLTQSSLRPEDLFGYGASGWNLGAGLTAPVFHGGALRAGRRAAEADARAAMARYQATVLRAFVQVADALGALAHDDEAIAAYAHARSAAENTLSDNRRGFDLGGTAFVDVVRAQRRVNDAQRKLVAAQGQRYLDLIRLLAATASDWSPAPPDSAAKPRPAPG
jgi:NodT family efflux transporter outer membrane factor (OMF) lipoprotein